MGNCEGCPNLRVARQIEREYEWGSGGHGKIPSGPFLQISDTELFVDAVKAGRCPGSHNGTVIGERLPAGLRPGCNNPYLHEGEVRADRMDSADLRQFIETVTAQLTETEVSLNA